MKIKVGRASLEDVIEKVEKAKEGSRQLDRTIWRAIVHRKFIGDPPPFFTKSSEDASSLVPPDWIIRLDTTSRSCTAQVNEAWPGVEGIKPTISARCVGVDCQPRAIIVAALRARGAQGIVSREAIEPLRVSTLSDSEEQEPGPEGAPHD